MAKDKDKNIKVSAEIYKKLKALKHPGQSFNGLFIEMLEKLGYKKGG